MKSTKEFFTDQEMQMVQDGKEVQLSGSIVNLFTTNLRMYHCDQLGSDQFSIFEARCNLHMPREDPSNPATWIFPRMSEKIGNINTIFALQRPVFTDEENKVPDRENLTECMAHDGYYENAYRQIPWTRVPNNAYLVVTVSVAKAVQLRGDADLLARLLIPAVPFYEDGKLLGFGRFAPAALLV